MIPTLPYHSLSTIKCSLIYVLVHVGLMFKTRTINYPKLLKVSLFFEERVVMWKNRLSIIHLFFSLVSVGNPTVPLEKRFVFSTSFERQNRQTFKIIRAQIFSFVLLRKQKKALVWTGLKIPYEPGFISMTTCSFTSCKEQDNPDFTLLPCFSSLSSYSFFPCLNETTRCGDVGCRTLLFAIFRLKPCEAKARPETSSLKLFH